MNFKSAVRVMSFQTMSITMIVVQVGIFLISKNNAWFPEIDVFRTIIATGAQIIVALYGVTMASYTFFLSKIDTMVLGDNTLDFVCQNIKYRFKYLIWFITWNVAITISTSISLLYIPLPNTENTSYFYRVFCNEFLLSLIFGIALILIYSLMVINPNVIEKEAEKLKKRLSRNSSVSGSVTEFIINYRNLVEKCTQMLPENLRKQIEENKGKILTIRWSY